jgi:hypothetical protein
MGYPAIAKSLAGTALDIVPGGSAVKGVLKGVTSLFGGKGPKYAKSLAETRAAGKAGDIATLQYKLANTKYPQVAASAKAYLDLLQAKSTGSRSDGMQWLKAQTPVLVSGGGPMGGITSSLVGMNDVTGEPRKRRRKSSKRSRKSSSSRRSKPRTRRKSKKRSSGRRLKFGSKAYREKYLGHR